MITGTLLLGTRLPLAPALALLGKCLPRLNDAALNLDYFHSPSHANRPSSRTT
jgi:hypothetical protein